MVNPLSFAKAAALFGAALSMAFGTIGPALGQGLIGMKACENVGKYPENSGNIRTTMLIAMGLVETSAIYALLVSGALLWVGWTLE